MSTWLLQNSYLVSLNQEFETPVPPAPAVSTNRTGGTGGGDISISTTHRLVYYFKIWEVKGKTLYEEKSRVSIFGGVLKNRVQYQDIRGRVLLSCQKECSFITGFHKELNFTHHIIFDFKIEIKTRCRCEMSYAKDVSMMGKPTFNYLKIIRFIKN